MSIDRRPSIRRAAASVAAAVLAASVFAVLPATAAYAADNHEAIDFSGYALGQPKGQNGWGSHTSRTYDFEIVDSAGRALRLSNATNDSSDYSQMSQLFAPRLAAKAGESSTGAPNDVFEMTFVVESATGGFQEGLNISVSASGERSDGAQPQNRAGGLVNLTHLDGDLVVWSTWPADGVPTDEWRNVSARVSPATAHTIRYVVQFVDGDDNDVASLWVDGVLVSDQLESWENYHDAAEAFAKQTVEGPLFRISRSIPTEDGIGYGTSDLPTDDVVAALDGEGLLIRDLSYATFRSTPTDPPAPTTEPAPETDGMDAEATPDGDELQFEATGFDPFENVAVTVYSTPYFAGWFRADAAGRVAGTITLPSSIPGGLHTLGLAGENGNYATAQFQLVRLAATGANAADALPYLVAVGLMLLIGTGLIVAQRRASRRG